MRKYYERNMIFKRGNNFRNTVVAKNPSCVFITLH